MLPRSSQGFKNPTHEGVDEKSFDKKFRSSDFNFSKWFSYPKDPVVTPETDSTLNVDNFATMFDSFDCNIDEVLTFF